MGLENFIMQMAITIQENGKMIKLMVKANTCTNLDKALFLKENGKMTFKVDLEKRFGLMAIHMKEIIQMDKKREKVLFLMFYFKLC